MSATYHKHSLMSVAPAKTEVQGPCDYTVAPSNDGLALLEYDGYGVQRYTHVQRIRAALKEPDATQPLVVQAPAHLRLKAGRQAKYGLVLSLRLPQVA